MEIRKPIYLAIFFAISICIYIISCTSPYYSNNFYSKNQWDGLIYIGALLGFLLIFFLLIMLYYHNFKTVKVLSPIGTLSMILSLVFMSIEFKAKYPNESRPYYSPTFTFYLFVISVIINVILIIPTMMLPKTTKHPKIKFEKQFRLSKLAKEAIFILIFAFGILLINLIGPTSTSYAFILFVFPVMLIIGIILLIIGLIISIRKKSEGS